MKEEGVVSVKIVSKNEVKHHQVGSGGIVPNVIRV
jgi:hypothetical protein